MVKYDYKKLLEQDSNLARWYNNLKRSSPVAADASLRRIGYVCRVFKVTIKQLAKTTPQKGFELIDDVVTKLHAEKKQTEYMRAYVKVLKSFFAHNNIQITQKINVPSSDGSSKVAQEQAPNQSQLRRLLNASDQKQKVESTLIALSGLRSEAIGNYEITDGLKIKDLPELQVDNDKKTAEFAKIPSLLIVRPNLSKAGHQYFTFIPSEECEYIKQLLEFRMKSGEELRQDSPVVTSLRYHKRGMEGKHTEKDKLYVNKCGHIKTGNISDSIRAAIGKAEFDWRPYILGSYFDTRMRTAEADSLIIRDWRTFWMGHKGDIEHKHTMNKKLPEDLIEKMRLAF